MRGAYQSTGLALLLLAVIWIYETTNLGHNTVRNHSVFLMVKDD